MTLTLASCNIDSNVARGLARVFRHNSILRNVNLSSNHIDDEAVDDLTESLRRNTSLSKLVLHSNNFSSDGHAALIDVLAENDTLRELSLGYIYMSEEMYLAIENAHAYDRVKLHFDLNGLARYINNRAAAIKNVTLYSIANIASSDCLEQLFRSMTNAPLLEVISIKADLHMSYTSAQLLSDMLNKSRHWREISLNIPLSDPKDMVLITKSLSNNKTVTLFSINYPCNAITLEFCFAYCVSTWTGGRIF